MSTFNLTAHELVFYDASGSTIRARLASHSELRLVSDTSDVPAHLSAWDVTDGHGVRVPALRVALLGAHMLCKGFPGVCVV